MACVNMWIVYDRLATFLAQHGMMVIGNDHLGHGETAKDEEELGYFPKAKGSETGRG